MSPQLGAEQWKSDLAFLVDVLAHLRLNVMLQGKSLIQLHAAVLAFKTKLPSPQK
jgi:hypothetical protein